MSTRSSRLLRVAATIALALGLAAGAGAQVTTGTLAGQVKAESDGSALPGVAIAAVHVPTGTGYSTTTGNDGRFVLPNLRVGGPYSVTATLDAFQAKEVTDLAVGLGSTTEVAIQLAVAAVSETIEVVGVFDDVINPNRTGSSSSIALEQIEMFPTVRRNLLDVAKTNPYASIRAGDENQKDISFAGRSSKYNNIQIDGSNYNDLFGLGESGGTPSGQANAQPIQLDALAELQVSVSPYDVRQGGFTGGAINAVTRSGSNDFHGSAYYAQRDPDYVGDGPFDTPIKDFDEEQFGASLGGRIIADKLFFFAAGEMNERTEPSGFSADGSTGQQFGKPEDAARFQNILLTNYGYDAGGLADIPIDTQSDHVFLRLDWNVADDHQLTLRHNYIDAFRDDVANRSRSVFRFPNATFSRDAQTDSTVAQLNSVFGSFFNEARIGFQTLEDVRTFPEAFPSVEVGGTGPRRGELIGGTEQFSGLNVLKQDILEITDDVTFLLGDHTITVGTHNEFFEFTNYFLASFYGYYYFPNLDALEAGVASEYQISFANGDDPAAPSSVFEVQQWGLYAGDQWRINDRVTFTYGLRGDLASFADSPAHNPAVEEAFGVDTTEVPGDNLILSPRVGFNWDPDGEGVQQLRGGLGIFAGRAPYVWISNAYSGTGVATTALTLRGAIPFNPDPLNQPHAGTGGVPTVDLIDPDFEFPQILRGTVGYDRNLPWWDMRGTAEVVYSETQQDIYYVNQNRVETGSNPLDGRPTYSKISTAFGDAPTLTNTGEGSELVVSLVLSRPVRSGFGFNAGYTYMDSENAFDGTSSRAISNWQFHPTRGDIFREEKSTSSWENEHRYFLNASYRFETGPLSHDVGLFYNAESGRPYSVLMGGDPNRDGFSTNDLLYVPGSPDEVIFQDFTWEQLQSYLSWHGIGGQGIVARNASASPWTRRFDFHYGLELPVKVVRVQVTADLINLANLLDSDKGVTEYVAFGTTTPITVAGTDPATGKEIWRQNFSNSITDPSTAFSTSDVLSRWQARLGLRLSF
jgi:outer membrane receptor for ferrienterochelin and colicin